MRLWGTITFKLLQGVCIVCVEEGHLPGKLLQESVHNPNPNGDTKLSLPQLALENSQLTWQAVILNST